MCQVPAKPNYSLVLYFAANRPINGSSLLGQFVDETDLFRDSRFKLIPISTDIEDLQWIRNKASTDVSKASTDNIHQRISASTDKTSTANASTDKASTDKASTDKASTDESFNGGLVQ
ncbi:hypothetical protein AgCh_002094 [Apium graveolens]